MRNGFCTLTHTKPNNIRNKSKYTELRIFGNNKRHWVMRNHSKKISCFLKRISILLPVRLYIYSLPLRTETQKLIQSIFSVESRWTCLVVSLIIGHRIKVFEESILDCMGCRWNILLLVLVCFIERLQKAVWNSPLWLLIKLESRLPGLDVLLSSLTLT